MDKRIELCTECDSERFPAGRDEGYVNLCRWRDRLLGQFHTPFDRLMAILDGRDEPDVTVTFDDAPINAESVMEFQAGENGWIVLFNDTYLTNERCDRCGDSCSMVVVVFGHVTFTAYPALAVAS